MYSGVVAVFSLVLLSGCATSRSEIALTVPEGNSDQHISAGQEVVIGEVIDRRVFEEAPREPSTPSLGKGGASKASDETKARAVGRKRNTYGMAMGDVLLENGQTVDEVVRSNLTLALRETGYNVLAHSTGVAANTPIIDVYIDEFWAWLNPGWSGTLNTRIATVLELRSNEEQERISVHALEHRHLATDGAWIEIIEKALNDYRNEVISVAPDLLEE
ncbi:MULTISPECIES: hypothetical protein [Halomonas]|uniref:hypothetical protein n=1 Tax=Halomonas TaxID=2745 RepID=UPI0018662202|nr:hypothetical protein [Halomonas citrativorans]